MSLRSLTTERLRRREQRIRQLEQERDAREAAVLVRVPRLGELKEIQGEIGLDLARLVLRAKTHFGKSFEELREWSQALSEERNRLLAQHGVAPADLEIHWDCPLCKNTGWLPPEQSGPDTVHPPRKCQCLIQDELDDLYRASGLTGSLRSQTFAQFDLTVYPAEQRKYMAKVLAYAKQYADGVIQGTQKESLLLMGEVGRGKTFLSSCIASAVVAAGRTTVYFTFSEFLDLLRLHRFDDDADYREGIDRLLNADLVVLDDLGAETVTQFVGQELFNIINHRMNRSLPMIVSTNLTAPEIEDYYKVRIASRLLNGFEAMELRGDDVRQVLKRRRTGV